MMARGRNRPLRKYGVSNVVNCLDGATEVYQVRGKTLKLKNFGFPFASYFGPVDTAQNPPEIPPIPSDSSGGMLSNVEEVDCLDANGDWCFTLPNDSPLVSQHSTNELVVKVVLWHYYQNEKDIHVLVEHCEFVFTPQTTIPNCTACGC